MVPFHVLAIVSTMFLAAIGLLVHTIATLNKLVAKQRTRIYELCDIVEIYRTSNITRDDKLAGNLIMKNYLAWKTGRVVRIEDFFDWAKKQRNVVNTPTDVITGLLSGRERGR